MTPQFTPLLFSKKEDILALLNERWWKLRRAERKQIMAITWLLDRPACPDWAYGRRSLSSFKSSVVGKIRPYLNNTQWDWVHLWNPPPGSW